MNSKMLDINNTNKEKNEYTNSYGFNLKINCIERKSNIQELNSSKDKVYRKKG